MRKWAVILIAIQSWPTTARLAVLLAVPAFSAGSGYEVARVLISR
jgi:hypothetical protein